MPDIGRRLKKMRRELIEADVAAGVVSAEAAKRDYGYEA